MSGELPAARVLDPTAHSSPAAPGTGSSSVLIEDRPAWRTILDDPPPAESMGFVALKNVERPMELMRIRGDEPVEPAERDEQDEPSAQETARDEVPVAAPADDATMRA